METNPHPVLMAQLSPFTQRRLQKLTKLFSTWEGDRRPMTTAVTELGLLEDEDESSPDGDCILWVDNAQGVVRAMNMVPSDTNHEAVVRSLIQAMEHPLGNLEPARPRKLMVKDREIQFFLRGALQNLDVEIEYSPELPLIDEIFQTFLQGNEDFPSLPTAYADQLIAQAHNIWVSSPWYLFSEQEILAIKLNHWNIDTLYLSVLGMADVEYGLLLYRSLDSLKLFRQQVLNSDQLSRKEIQQAFLSQDCLFVNFEPSEDEDGIEHIDYDFGSIHPLEGIRSELADEEAATFIVAMDALARFLDRHEDAPSEFAMYEDILDTFRIKNPIASERTKTITVTVQTLPQLSQELSQQTDMALGPNATTEPDLSERIIIPPLRSDTIPDGSLILLTELSPQFMQDLRASKNYYQPLLHPRNPANKTAPWPALIIQTTRPKANDLINFFQASGGIEAICFNPGSDFLHQIFYQLGLIKTTDGNFHIFHEYDTSSPRHSQALEKWQTSQQASQGHCAIAIASGISGKKRGQPGMNEIIGLFEANAASPQELNLAPLMLRNPN
jgi:hypothetical protein